MKLHSRLPSLCSSEATRRAGSGATATSGARGDSLARGLEEPGQGVTTASAGLVPNITDARLDVGEVLSGAEDGVDVAACGQTFLGHQGVGGVLPDIREREQPIEAVALRRLETIERPVELVGRLALVEPRELLAGPPGCTEPARGQEIIDPALALFDAKLKAWICLEVLVREGPRELIDLLAERPDGLLPNVDKRAELLLDELEPGLALLESFDLGVRRDLLRPLFVDGRAGARPLGSGHQGGADDDRRDCYNWHNSLPMRYWSRSCPFLSSEPWEIPSTPKPHALA